MPKRISPASVSGLHFIIFALLAVFAPAALYGNSEIRDWNMVEGGSITAEIASIDEESRLVVLRDVNGNETSVDFRNRLDNAEVFGRFEEVVPFVAAAVPYDPDRSFLGGTSGGALTSFVLSVQFPDVKVAGVYSNGGWLGRARNSRRPYQASRVALVNGDNDKAANGYNESVTRILHERGCTVGMFAFEGGHQVPPPSVQAKSFRWLLGEFD